MTKRFEWTEPRERDEKTIVSSWKKFSQMYDGKLITEKISNIGEESIFVCTYIIPYGTKQTLHSWNSLRDISKDAFKLNENKLFSRINDPYEIVVKVSGPTGVTTERVELDVFERWDALYNRDLSDYIITS